MKTLADLSYDELLARASDAADLPELRLAGHDVTLGHDFLHHYWTKGEGLAKWATSLHPWTTLYHHLIKHVDPVMAKRFASAWFHEVFGFWPGEKHVGGVKVPGAHRSALLPDDEEPDVRFGQIALVGSDWLRERANVFLRGALPDLADDDPIGDLDDDTRILVRALTELDDEHLRSFDPEEHKRYPKGHPLAGKFRPMVDLLKLAITSYNAGGRDRGSHPFEKFKREQLVNAAKARGIALNRGEDRDSIADKLLADLGQAKTPDGVEAARMRQADIDHARPRAELISEAEEWLGNQGSLKTMSVQLRRDAKHLGIEDNKDVAPLFDAIDSGDTAKVYAAIDLIAKRQRLQRVGRAGEVVTFDRASHDNIGGDLKPGDYAVVVRPGYRFDRDGELIRLHKAKAEKATADEIAAAKKALAAKKATLKAAQVPAHTDGLDDLDEHRLKSLAVEFDVPQGSRDQMIAILREKGAISPVITIKRNDALGDFDRRMKDMGRRKPKDAGPLSRAAELSARDADAKTVAKALRGEAAKVESKEDADTLRFLAADLTKRQAKPPSYLTKKGNIDLRVLAGENGIDFSRWSPLDKEPEMAHGPGGNWEYRGNHPFAGRFLYYKDALNDDLHFLSSPMPRAKIAREMRETAAQIRQQWTDANLRIGFWNSPGRAKERKNVLAQANDAAADMERLADLVQGAKVPPKKRGKTLGGTVLGEPVAIDEAKFGANKATAVIEHRGEKVPASFTHGGNGTALILAKDRQHRPGLTEAESRALDLYTVGVVADGLNGSLRKSRNAHGTVKGPRGPIDLDEVSANLDSALADSHLTEDTVLWRGALPTNSDFRRLVPGAIYSDGGYMSTSTDEKGARQTIHWRQNQGKLPAGRKPVLFKILAPKGTNAALGHEGVSEALLPRGQELRVVRVDESGDVPVAVMEVIPKLADPGHVRGRSLVDEFDYDAAIGANHPERMWATSQGRGDSWLKEIQKAQGFDGKPQVVSRQELDDVVAAGGMELFRGIRGSTRLGDAQPEAAEKLAELFRSGDLYPGVGVYGSGTYTTPKRDVAMKYGTGTEKGLIRMALRRDARVINYEELVKLPALKGITTSTQKLVSERQAELDKIDPRDADAVRAIVDKYEKLLSKRGARSQIGADLGRVAALLGYDAIIKQEGLKGRHAKKADPTAEIVILNRTAVYVEQAIP